ncbi:MAG TPA: TetR family transcriptional regulator, partial [Myxococcota bacterium]|nr:TetR family transcriptional regulator [Myxococcota bacterium]
MAPNDNEPTRERLIAAARELFLARGFAATSTRAIAAQAGCNLSLIKYYFGSKEGLLREMLRVQYAAIEVDVRELAAHDGPPAERLAAIIAAIAGRIDQNRELLRMMIRELATEDSPVAVEVAGLVRMVQNPIIALL